ncbi:MAG: glycosyltransferase, partial [Pseudomonadota bacterium]
SSIEKNSVIHYFKTPIYRTNNKVSNIFEITSIKEFTAPEFFRHGAVDILKEIKMLNSADKIIVHSDYMAEEISSRLFVDEKKIKVIPKGIHIYNFEQNAPKLKLPEKFIMFAGRISKYKNLNMLINVFERTLPKNIHLIIAGTGEDIPARNRVINIGYIHPTLVQSVMKKALCLVEPSFVNDHPDTILEAMAAEIPVVASDIKAHRSVCANSALYFSPLSENSLAESLEAAISNKKLRDTLKKDGKEIADAHSWDKVVLKYKELYRSLA